MGRHAKALPLFEAVELEHHTVDFVGIPAAFPRPADRGLTEQGGRFGRRGRRVDFPRCGDNAEGVFQPYQHVRVVGHIRNSCAVRVAMFAGWKLGIVGLKHQISGVGFAVSMLLSKGARRQVARVGRCFTVLGVKHRQRHHDFTSYVNINGERERMGHVGDLSGISRDILAALATPPSGGSHQTAHAIFQRKSGPVQFRLGKELQGTGGGDIDEVVQFFSGGGLVEAAHGKEVVHLHASRSDVSANTAELWMLGVELLEFVPEAVEFCVAQLGLSEVVVQVGMVSDLLSEEGDTSLSGIGG